MVSIVVLVIVFFKQKTAYEMRISDWSSDVCSSDRTLDEQSVLLYADLHLMNEYTSPQAFAGMSKAKRTVAVPGAHVAVVDHIIPTHAVAPREIGRESCRERVCQYV